MARVLLLFSTADGQTERIAERLRECLLDLGHRVTLRRAAARGAFDAIAAHDAVLVGGSIRYGRHSRALERGIRKSLGSLEARPNAFFSVCLSAGGPGAKPENVATYLRDFAERTGWQARRTAAFAGALLYRKYNPLIRLLMRLIVGSAGGETDTSRDYEYTDWKAVERLAADFAADLPR
jgi:menaquinone-dependent protoporphyrinogen oxidase